MKKKWQNWNLAFATLGAMGGALIAQIIMYFVNREFNLSALLGILSGGGILIIINIVYVFSKKDNTPEIDERIRNNMFKFLFYVSHIFIAFLFIGLTIISFLGVDNIPLSYLWIIIIAYLLISGIGGMIVSRR